MPSHQMNFSRYTVIFDAEQHLLKCTYVGRGCFLEGICIQPLARELPAPLRLADFATIKVENVPGDSSWGNTLYIRCADGPACLPALVLRLFLDRAGLHVSTDLTSQHALRLSGRVNWGEDPKNATFAMCLGRQGADLRAACGPAAAEIDDCLFDRDTDSMVRFSGSGALRLSYDWGHGSYTFAAKLAVDESLHVQVVEEVYQRQFCIPYKPINKHSTFSAPPVGWMTWYAVKFGASERTVLENARWQAENLARYGANCIWVDWEWYHSSMKGEEPEGVDIFHPRLDAYPHGLAYVAQEIRQLGLVPALWICPTIDTNPNEFLRENPDAILDATPRWCGRYVLDPTHPKVKSEFIPNVFNTIRKWGYDAIKWDADYVALTVYDQRHDDFHDPAVASSEALRELYRSARATVGDDCFMLACIGPNQRDLPLCLDFFDAARIGNDIFSWDDFLKNGVQRLYERYVYHNVVLYADPDNVVVRPEFNTAQQAVSRVSLVSLLGLPITFGDNLPELPDDRVELLRRIIPSVDAHPMDIEENSMPPGRAVIVNLAVNRPFEQWNVVSVFNPKEETTALELSLGTDVHLPAGETYLVYDFWARTCLGEVTDLLCLTLEPCESRVLGIRKQQDVPQLVSTSRHITQGAYDLVRCGYDGDARCLSGRSRVVAGEDYVITFRVPEGCVPEPNPDVVGVGNDICTLTVVPDHSGEMDWCVNFL